MRYNIRCSSSTLEDNTIALSRNVGKRTPSYAVTHTKRLVICLYRSWVQPSPQCFMSSRFVSEFCICTSVIHLSRLSSMFLKFLMCVWFQAYIHTFIDSGNSLTYKIKMGYVEGFSSYLTEKRIRSSSFRKRSQLILQRERIVLRCVSKIQTSFCYSRWYI
jgi:hypothetical protein